jgi:hypothetical protein
MVYFYNVSAGEREFAVANVWEGGDEEMGPVTGLVHRRVPREGVSLQSVAYTEARVNRWGRWLKGVAHALGSSALMPR